MENDFSYGMKVSLNNESGVVIKDQLDGFNLCGVICWDTPKENDIEDWRGQFSLRIIRKSNVINYFNFIIK